MTNIMSSLPLSSYLFEDRDFNYALLASVLLHIIIIIIFLFGIPSFINNRFEDSDVMTFDVLPLSAISNVEEELPKIDDNKSSVSRDEGKKNITKAVDVQEEKVSVQNDKKITTQEAIPETKNTPEIVKQEKVQVPKKTESKPKETVTSKAQAKKVTPKKNNNTRQKPKSGDDIDALLNDLEQSAGNNKQSNLIANGSTDGIKYTRSAVYDDDSPLSITEKMLVKNQIKRNWQPPVGSQHIDNIKVSLQMKLHKDGSVDTVNIIRVECPSMQATYVCKLVADSAIRAVKKASPFANLLPDRYDVWQYFNVIFDPGD